MAGVSTGLGGGGGGETGVWRYRWDPGWDCLAGWVDGWMVGSVALGGRERELGCIPEIGGVGCMRDGCKEGMAHACMDGGGLAELADGPGMDASFNG